MASSISECFTEFLNRLAPSSTENDARSRHRTTIEQGLTAAFSGFNRIEVFGSHTRGSAIKTYSDVDYLAVLGVADVKRGDTWVQSSTILSTVKAAMEARFPGTKIRVDGPSAVVHFGQGHGAVDVVPAIWGGMTDTDPKRPLFSVPDGDGWWRASSPQLHADHFRYEDQQRARSKLSRTIQLLKAWKYAREVPIPALGFHLELLLASNDISVGVKSYQDCLYAAFKLLSDRRGAGLRDPMGVAGLVPAARTEAQRASLAEAASHAAYKAERAIIAELDGRLDDARDLWNQVFNGIFPAR